VISAAVVNRFAGALADIVVQKDSGITPLQVVDQLRSFEAALREAPALGQVLASPAVSSSRKRVVIGKIADVLGLAPLVRNFVLVLNDHRRTAALTQVIDAFELLVDERLGFVPAEVRSAAELGDDQRKTLADELARLAGSEVRLRFTVDPSLIGGATARIGSKVYDGSIRGQLGVLRQRLAVNSFITRSL
jgi:F-type H+-transporting ATPase subunit delta